MLGSFLRDLRRDTSGATLIEFAFAVPLLILLYTMAYVLSDGYAASRKVTYTVHTVLDLATRYASLTPSTLSAVMAASTQVMLPYDASKATIRVSELLVTSSTTATVVWSQSQNGTALTAGTSVPLPSASLANNTYVLWGEVAYTYKPLFSGGRTMVFYDQVVMGPRLSSSIPMTTS